VSYNCPTGPKEIIRPDVDGFLIDNDDEEFGRSVSKLMRDPELRSHMGKAGAEDVERRFSGQQVIRTWVNLIEALHSEKGNG
jgi:glycosyltransferase involved in cell wall biosynthesis